MTGTVVVGGSIGGVRTVQRLRQQGYTGRITLVERESRLPYDRPPLSKAVLTDGRATLPVLLSATEADTLDVDLALGVEAAGLDVDARAVRLADGTSIEYDDAAVVATGARARSSSWSALPGVLELRSWDDAARLRRALDVARRLVVIGAGFIGAEVASAARKRDLAVDIVDVAEVPMARHLGVETGSLFAGLHERHGVETHFGVGVRDLRRRGDGLQVMLTDGTALVADLVVAGLGTDLNTGWLRHSGVRVDDGVVCDSTCRALGTSNVFAVGDAARWWHAGYGELTRAEHWTNAVEQAAVVAHNIVHPDAPRDHVPTGYVWSDQYDWKIQIAGRPWIGRRHEMVRVNPDRFAVLWADDANLLCGLVTVNWPQVAVRGRQALAAGRTFAEATTALLPRQRAEAAVVR